MRGGRAARDWRLSPYVWEKSANFAGPDHAVAAVAARQHGVVTTSQLDAAGVAGSSVWRRVKTGRLHRIHRGVFAVGHPRLSREGIWMAAVLAVGDGAVLSHTAAAALWDLLPAVTGPVDITVPGDGGRRKRRGIRLHRSSSLTDSATTRRHGIPVTTPARTIRDLRRCAPAHRLRRAIRQAELLGLDLGSAESDRTRSELEHLFLRLCRLHRLPHPEVNVRVGEYIVDFLWRGRHLIVEVDGYEFHRGRSAFEADRARDAKLKVLGFDVVRFTHRQLTSDPELAIAALRALLRDRA